jgi:predicted Kef-type K+ transport protein
LAHITNVRIESHKYVLPWVVKKKVVAASTEAFPTAGLALQLDVSMTAASIPGLKVGQEC